MSTAYDYIVVGGGLTGSVVASRLIQHDASLKIVVIEAGGDTLDREDIMMQDMGNSLHLIGGDLDWKILSVPQKHADGRTLVLPQGKGLGGGTTINGGGWIRGDRMDYDAWAAEVGDHRWSYDGQLPFMKKSEKHTNATVNPDQHGYEGPVVIQTPSSSGRAYPLREKVLESWSQLGVKALPHLDGNAGSQLGVAEVNENRNQGRRQVAAAVYSLDGVIVMTESLVEKVILERQEDGSIVAAGVKLADESELRSQQVILAAGALRTPQILMLSGIGAPEELSNHSIQTLVESPEVGKNLADHTLLFTAWKLKNPDDGWAVGSKNALFTQPQYALGLPMDFVVTTDVPKEGLAVAIEVDEGVKPDASSHALLKQARPFSESFMVYAGAPDGSAVAIGVIDLHPTTRGAITLDPSNVRGTPLVDTNYLGTEVDRYVHREMLRKVIDFAASDKTTIGRDILEGEMVPPGVEPLSVGISDAALDGRARSTVGTSYHFHGTAAMGKVVDTDLKVKGVRGLRVVDASVIPVNLATHLQVPLYALAEQAAAIITQERDSDS
ncbi:hypothetical protein JX266_012394 [Neoarthrinium moseri]|uniref:uncharacterized protein n=1 Tax=Neoarthrinium moseri TaxID=1658444 RepID=UPI001FDE71B7|nr:uncharacterized protein JN550_009826 [Neoarthrinium moseri]KAI1841383.1 hypothetical protein JX266_012394 [Neoarthrinium moseri]KAI1863090.1 hypothetical protein JN550_009826 [Neoarthrinium moseri]